MRSRSTPFIVALIALTGAAIAPMARAAGPNPDAKLVLHLVPTETRRGATCFSGLPKDVHGVVTKGDLYPQQYFAYVMIADIDTSLGIAGVQFGISYDDSVGRGVDIITWQNCALYEWPLDDWPERSGTGNLLTWNLANDCQVKVPIPVGFFFLTAYSPDRLKLIPRPVDGQAKVAVCGVSERVKAGETSSVVDIDNLGWVDFGGDQEGYNPWDPEKNLKTLRNRTFKPIQGKN